MPEHQSSFAVSRKKLGIDLNPLHLLGCIHAGRLRCLRVPCHGSGEAGGDAGNSAAGLRLPLRQTFSKIGSDAFHWPGLSSNTIF